MGILIKTLLDELYVLISCCDNKLFKNNSFEQIQHTTNGLSNQENRTKIWNFTKIMQDLDLINPKNIVLNKSSLSLENLKIVTIFSLNHVHQAMYY
jgi:hypothetical protein